jgi:hypothetical protein
VGFHFPPRPPPVLVFSPPVFLLDFFLRFWAFRNKGSKKKLTKKGRGIFLNPLKKTYLRHFISFLSHGALWVLCVVSYARARSYTTARCKHGTPRGTQPAVSTELVPGNPTRCKHRRGGGGGGGSWRRWASGRRPAQQAMASSWLIGTDLKGGGAK